MKNKLYILLLFIFLTASTSCEKDLIGNTITVESNTNDTVTYFRIYNSCEPGPNSLPLGTFDNLNYFGNGNYDYQIEKGYDDACFTITGTIPENTNTTGVTTVSINAYYTEAGNVVGFQDLELKRPHVEYKISYEFRADTYIE